MIPDDMGVSLSEMLNLRVVEIEVLKWLVV